ncbi:MAG: FliM/FliN family flagellar motor switch protein [Acidobacteriota bacterium]
MDDPKLDEPAPPTDGAGTPARSGAGQLPPNLDLVLDIELPVWARFGQTEMTLAQLAKLGPGTSIDLDRSPEDPVELLVNDTVVARGDVVVASGHYGIRVTEVVGRADRMRSLGPLRA